MFDSATLVSLNNYNYPIESNTLERHEFLSSSLRIEIFNMNGEACGEHFSVSHVNCQLGKINFKPQSITEEI